MRSVVGGPARGSGADHRLASGTIFAAGCITQAASILQAAMDLQLVGLVVCGCDSGDSIDCEVALVVLCCSAQEAPVADDQPGPSLS